VFLYYVYILVKLVMYRVVQKPKPYLTKLVLPLKCMKYARKTSISVSQQNNALVHQFLQLNILCELTKGASFNINQGVVAGV